MMPVPTSEESSATEQKISTFKDEAKKQTCALKCLAYTFMILGVAFMCNGVHCMLTSRGNAEYIVVHHKLPFGHKKLPMPEGTGSEYMPADELELYDLLKNIGMLTVAMGFGLLLMGCMAKKAIKWQKKWCVKRVLRKSYGCLVWFFAVYLLTKQQGKAFMTVFLRNADEETKAHMERKGHCKIGMCPVMIVLIILQLVHLYKLRSFKHSIEKVALLEEVKKEEDQKNSIISAI